MACFNHHNFKGVEKMREWLRELRKKKGMTQQETADVLKIAANYYSMIENGKRQPKMTIETAQKIAKIFEVPIEYIFGNVNICIVIKYTKFPISYF